VHSIPPRPSVRVIPRLQTGDLIAVRKANDKINVYAVSNEFSFANIICTATSGEMGIVISNFTDRQDSILFHYVQVLFERGIVGIVHSGLLKNISEEFETNEY
jgi:hypothetical protein